MSSIFKKIINGEIPCYKIAEDSDFLPFWILIPMLIGHTLCIPKKEVDRIMDLDEETYMGSHGFFKESGESNNGCNRL